METHLGHLNTTCPSAKFNRLIFSCVAFPFGTAPFQIKKTILVFVHFSRDTVHIIKTLVLVQQRFIYMYVQLCTWVDPSHIELFDKTLLTGIWFKIF